MSKPNGFKWRKAPTQSPAPQEKTAVARPSEPRAQAAATTRAAQAVPAPTAERPKPSHEEIALRAYELWQSEGGGTDVENWLRAERQLAEVSR